MTTKPTTLNEYIDELDRLVTQGETAVHTYYGTASSAFELTKRILLQEFRRNTMGVLRPIAREHKDEVNPIRQENARLRRELDLERKQHAADIECWNQVRNELIHQAEQLKWELDKVSAERDDLARMVLEAAGILRPQEEPEVRYFKTTNARHPIYYRAAGGVLEVWHDSGRWVGSSYDSLEHLSAVKADKLISVSRSEAEA